MWKTFVKKATSILCCAVLALGLLPLASVDAYALDNTKIGVTTSGKATYSTGSDTITAQVNGKGTCFNGPQQQEGTLTITNNYSNNALLTFDYTVSISKNADDSNSCGITVDGSAELLGAGKYSFSKTLNAGGSINIILKSPQAADYYTKVELTNVQLVEDNSITVQFLYNPLGRYSVGGVEVTEENSPYETSFNGAVGIQVEIIEIAPDYKFASWNDVDTGTELKEENSKLFVGETVKKVTPRFVPSMFEKVFRVGGVDYYTWEEAFTAAGSGGTVKLIKNTVLPDTLEENGLSENGTYVTETSTGIQYRIPTGVKFLVPYDAETDSGEFNDTPLYQTTGGGITQGVCLTVQSGCEIYSDGSINVNAIQSAENGTNRTGQPVGKYGRIILKNGSYLRLNSGTLYCYGYITGDFSGGKQNDVGTVIVDNTATVYECFQLSDWRGGTATLQWYTGSTSTDNTELATSALWGDQSKFESMPFSQYYVQNIEANCQIGSTATLYTCAAITAAGETTQSSIEYIGKNGLFRLASGGEILRTYDPLKDRITYQVQGGLETGNITIEQDAVITKVKISSAEHILALPSNYTFQIMSGGSMTVNSNVKFLPGTEIIVDEDASMTVTDGKSMFIYDVKDWNAQQFIRGGHVSTAGNSPSRSEAKGTALSSLNASAKIEINGTLNAYSNIFTTVNGNTSTDKVLYGTGKFINNVAQTAASSTLDEIANNDATTVVTITTTPVVGMLAGKTQKTTDNPYDQFGNSTYYGLGSEYGNYWYQHTISVANGKKGITAVNTAPSVGEVNGYMTASNGDTNVVGYAVDGGTFSFNVPGQAVVTCDDSNDSTQYTGANQTLANPVTADRVLTLYVAKIMNDGTLCTSLADAAGKYTGTGYIQMLADSTEPNFELSKNLTLDLNGKTVNATVTIADSCILNGVDSSTNGFKDATVDNPLGKITVAVSGTSNTGKVDTVTNLNSKDYVAVQEGNTYTFHRFAITPNAYQFYFNPNGHSHLVFEAVAQGDRTVCSMVQDLGFTVTECVTSGTGKTTTNWYKTDMNVDVLPKEFAAATEKIVSFAAIQFDDTASFDVMYTVVAIADFSDDHSSWISSAAENPEEESHKITFRSALEQYLDYLNKQAELKEEEIRAQNIIKNFLDPNNQS